MVTCCPDTGATRQWSPKISLGIFKKDLFEVQNPRLQRMREKVLPYTFTLKWVAGKGHHIADALSRAPLFAPADLDDMHIDTACVWCQRKARKVNSWLFLIPWTLIISC